MLTRQIKATICSLALCLLSFGAHAFDLPDPKGPVILTVTQNTDGQSNTAEFDIALLASLGTDSFETSTIWTEGTHTFTGVPLANILSALNVRDGEIKATAINDYSITIPVSDALQGGPMIAYEMDGLPMSVRDKGPLWIVYPYDSEPGFQNEVTFSRSIWQLNRLHVQTAS